MNSSCVLISGEYGWTNDVKRTLEINTEHKIIQHMKTTMETDDGISKGFVQLMYDTCCINFCFTLDQPADFRYRIYNMMSLGMGIDTDDSEVVDGIEEVD